MVAMKMPEWAHLTIPDINYQDIIYYSAPKQKVALSSMDEVDPELRATFEKLGIPLEEQKMMSGVAVDAVMDSVSVKTTFRETLAEMGIIFCSFSEAVKEHPDLVKKYMASVVPYTDNYFATLNSAVFSDGSFCYIPKGVRCPMQNEHNGSYHISNIYIHQEATSVVNTNTITLHGGVVRNNINVALVGEGAENHIYGLSLVDKTQHVDNYSFVDHAVPNCISNELFKNVMDDMATGAFNGRILVRKDAQQTQASQTNNNLLLTDDARIYTKPQLEIYADDVKCSHELYAS